MEPIPARDAIPLDGRLERTRLSHVVAALLALVTAFFLFQAVFSPVTLFVVLMAKGISPTELLANMDEILGQEGRALLIANTVGQVFGIGLVALLFARLHSSRPLAFLRVRPTDARAIALTTVGILAIIPVTQFLGSINEMIPLPDWLREMEQAQMDLLENALLRDAGFFFNLVVLAITPAICEELLFRGYVQRQAERGLGVAGGIAFSGILFGAYHLRLTHIVPLTIVGLYLAYVAWQFRSLWPPIIGHFLFNGIAVAVGAWSATDGANIDDIDKLEVPWYLFLTGLVILGVVIAVSRKLERDEPALRESDPILEHPRHE